MMEDWKTVDSWWLTVDRKEFYSLFVIQLFIILPNPKNLKNPKKSGFRQLEKLTVVG